jgi:hypothetical protein
MTKRAPVGEVRAWAKEQGFQLGDRGRLPAEVWDAWNAASSGSSVPEQRLSDATTANPTADALQAAHARIAELEKQVVELTDQLANPGSRPAPPLRVVARSR